MWNLSKGIKMKCLFQNCITNLQGALKNNEGEIGIDFLELDRIQENGEFCHIKY